VSEPPFFHAAVAVAAGLGAQVLATRAAVPSIVLLLAAGALIGPDGLGILDPDAFGAGRTDLVRLAVVVILFEGGLALDLGRLRQQQRSLLLLLTLGAAISMAAGTVAAHAAVGFPWGLAVLFGALVIVTGPTVVTPLLSRLAVDRPVRELLIGEGVVIDPIGAIVAIVAIDYVLGHAVLAESGLLVLLPLVVGGAVGVAAGRALVYALQRQWIAEDLGNAVVLGSVLLVAALVANVSREASLMAAVAQGATMANAGLRELARLREFKETLTTILLSFVFVVLAADLRLQQVMALGWGALAVVAVLAWVARPLAVFLCTVGSELTLRQRLFMAWICPRGIVAAAVAGLFQIKLRDAGVPGGPELEALVFVTIAVTVAVQGLTAGRVAHLLGVDLPSVRGTIVVGADNFGRFLARLLTALQGQVVVVDRSPMLARLARKEGLTVFEGDALSVDTLEEAGARYADTLIALTRNYELNALVVQRAHASFRVERCFALADDPKQRAAAVGAGVFPGEFPGVDEANRLLRLGRLWLAEYEVPETEVVGRALRDLSYGTSEFALLVGRGPNVLIATGEQTLAAGDRLWCMRPPRTNSPLALLLRFRDERDPRSLAGSAAPA
jgi:NhaP-type Na+/H+ or K+/H+ antiporter